MTNDFKVGDIVQMTPEAVYYTGRQVSPLIKSKQWIIAGLSGNRILLGKSDDGYYNLNAPIDAKYLIKV